jgi:hypothetical protein
LAIATDEEENFNNKVDEYGNNCSLRESGSVALENISEWNR